MKRTYIRSFIEEIPFVTCIANISRNWESFRLSTAALTKSLDLKTILEKKLKEKWSPNQLLQSKQLSALLRTVDAASHSTEIPKNHRKRLLLCFSKAFLVFHGAYGTYV